MEIEELNKIINKGERTRILFDLLMETIGSSYDEPRTAFFEKLKITFEEYEKATKELKKMVQESIRVNPENNNKKTDKKESVSVSNY